MAAVLGPIGQLADHAILHAHDGLEIFPVDPSSKRPLVSQYKATLDTDVIGDWWARWPDALIGHRIADNQVLTDIDPRHHGHDVWRALCDTHGKPETRAHYSGRGDGGGHLWWHHTLADSEIYQVTALEAWGQERQLGEPTGNGRWTTGIDVLHRHHRYTILPPSPHPETGQPYRWKTDAHAPITELPDWFRIFIVATKPQPNPQPSTTLTSTNSIFERFNLHYSFNQILTRHGWILVRGNGEDDGSYWRHPTATAEHSASIKGRYLYIHSPNTPFDPTGHGDPHGYDIFDCWRILDGHGDRSNAARVAGELLDGPLPPRIALETLIAPSPNGTKPEPTSEPHLRIESIATLTARVDSNEHPGFLAQPVWPADAYGVIGAENKAGKSWAILDLAVTTAAGLAWLDQYPIQNQGNVLVFLGEGGERKTVRRLRAVAEHYGVNVEDLPIRVCHKVPRFQAANQITEVIHELDTNPATLIIVDPLYLAAAGAKSSSIFEMAEVLQPVQHAAQDAHAALVVVHHWNKTGQGTDRTRFSGAGSAEWGRVLASVAVESRRTDTDGASEVVLGWEFIGDEIPDTILRLRRRVWTDNQTDLSSPMHYTVTKVESVRDDTPWDGPTHCMDAIIDLLTDAGAERSKNQLARELRDRGLSFRDTTIRAAAEQLVAQGQLVERVGPRQSVLFRLPVEDGNAAF